MARYDKINLVIFGEYVPLRLSYPPIYNWLNAQTPWGKGGRHYSLTAGTQFTVFEFDASDSTKTRYRAGTPICYEENMPYIARSFALGDGGSDKNIDLILAISNDGWFLHSSELEQHLAAGVFRAVENRIAVARSVNTGASAMIHPNGKVHSRVRMPEEQIQQLDRVTGALEELKRQADALEGSIGQPEAYTTALQQITQGIGNELRSALEALGPEFSYIETSLSHLRGNLVPRNKNVAAVIDLFRRQIDEDLRIVERWKDRPSTAPGFIIDTALCDTRKTLYTRWGDWFAHVAIGLTAIMLLDWFVFRFRYRKRVV